jgi:hypothetical protein
MKPMPSCWKRLLAFFFFGCITLVQGWTQGRLELNLQVGRNTPLDIPDPLLITEDYRIESIKSIGGEAQLRYSYPMTPSFFLSGGLGYGIQPADLSFRSGPTFSGLPTAIEEAFTLMPLHHLFGLLGVRLEAFPSTPHKLGFQAGVRYVYPLRSNGSFSSNFFDDNDQIIPLLTADITQNPDNQLFFAPEVGAYFRWQAQDRPIGWQAGINYSWSLQETVTGTYTFFGKDQELSGTIVGQYRALGVWFSAYVLFD